MSGTTYDVIIIGGGPAGSAAGSVLARQKINTIIFEKERFPRYHIGESLLPASFSLFSEMGVIDKLKMSNFIKKYSVQFVSSNGKQSLPFYFDQHIKNDTAQTWQVERSEFDRLLLDNAEQQGATVHQREEVVELIKNETGRILGCVVKNKNGELKKYYSRVVIDASGRSAVSASQYRWRNMDEQLKKIAIWTYYEGAKRDEGKDAGATTIAYADGKNWFWYIPLANNIVSIGIVGEKNKLSVKDSNAKQVFELMAAKNSWIVNRLESGKQIKPFQITGDYSYRSQYCAIDGLVLIGDAFAFLDPVFSSGVCLALYMGVQAAHAIIETLPNTINARSFKEYGENVCNAIEIMRKIVYAFYDQHFNFNKFLAKYPSLKSKITDVLIGNFSQNYTDLFIKMQEFMTFPVEISYGRAAYQ